MDNYKNIASSTKLARYKRKKPGIVPGENLINRSFLP